MIYRSGQIERFRVTGRNRSIIIQNNLPLIESSPSKRGRTDWKLIGDVLYDAQLLSAIFRAVERMRK